MAHAISFLRLALELFSYSFAGPTDVVDGNPKRVLGLIWAIFVYYEVLSIPDVKSVSDLKDKILSWSRRRTTRYAGRQY